MTSAFFVKGQLYCMWRSSKCMHHIARYCTIYREGLQRFGLSCPKILPTNQPNIFFVTAWQHWLGIAKPKNVFRSTLNLCIKLLWIFYLTDFSIDWLTDQPTDWLSDWLHNSITAKAMGLVSSLFNIASSLRHVFSPTTATPMLASWFYQSLPLFSFVWMICGTTTSWLHRRLSNCSDCKSVYHAILLLEMFCKMLDNTEIEKRNIIALSPFINRRSVHCRARIFHISI